MKGAILSAALTIALMAGVSTQDKPNFAGKWKASGSFTSWTITVEGSKMTVTRTVAGNSESIFYMLDGTPTKNALVGAPGDNVYVSTWEGDVLVTTITGPANTLVERRSIEPDGTMRVQTTLTMLQGKPAPPPPPGAGAGLVLKKIG
jgi:hypothetical protein